jgi:hypothetical protein
MNRTRHSLEGPRLSGSRTMCALLLGLFFASMTVPAHADVVTPLRKDSEFANGIVRTLHRLGEGNFRPPGLSVRHAFNAIAPDVIGVNSLIQFGLSESTDAAKLSSFAREVIQNRLSELQVSNDIAIKKPSGLDVIRQVDCELLRLDFLIDSSESEVAGARIVVIIVDLWAWQDARLRLSDGTTPCIDTAPPLVGRDARRTFVVQVGEREKAQQQLREEIINIIDTAVVLRVVASNGTALETVHSWAEGAN